MVLTLVAVVWAAQDPVQCTQHVPIYNINTDIKRLILGYRSCWKRAKDPHLITSSQLNLP